MLALSLALLASTRAEIPEPDNVLYGTITLDNVAVSASRTDVVVEARRLTDGPAIASYRMGSNPQAGNFYSLRLKVESFAPVLDADASQPGANLFIVVRDASGVRDRANFTLTERGQVQRLDFGTAIPDSDGDGLPDAWENHYFGNLNQNAGSIGANGLSGRQNFIAGTNPNDSNSAFRLSIKIANNLKEVSFTALRAEGPGYEGLTRLYSLETSPGITPASWTGVAGFINIAGNNQALIYQTAGTSVPAFFRGRITLQPPNSPTMDSDGDGLPDAWETLHFGNLGRSAGFITANGQSALQNYVAGNNPNDAESGFKLRVTISGGQEVISFQALRAEGTGYEGKQRLYTLQYRPALAAGPWTDVPGFIKVPATNQAVMHQATAETPGFFRAAVWLEDL